MKVVIDTNVFISSFFGGKPKEIIALWHHGKIIICVSQPIIDEYIEVLKRLGLQNEKELEELLNLFASSFNLIFTAKPPELSIIKTDPDDNKFIECAVGTGSKFIISGDKHLLEIERYIDIAIMNPNSFWEFFYKNK